MRSQLTLVLLMLLPAAGCAKKDPPPRSVQELIVMLQSDDPPVQVEGAQGVARLGPKAAEAVPALTMALKSPQLIVRQNAAVALGQIGAEGGVVPILITALNDNDFTVRTAAATALGQIGPAASSAIPALEQFAEQSKQGDRQGSSCGAATDALKKVRP